VVLQYLDTIFNNSLQIKNIRDENNRNVLLITLSFKNLIEHKQKTTKLLRSDTERLIFAYTQKWEDYVIDFGKNRVSRMERLIFRYMVKFQVGGSLRMLIDWMKHDMPIPAEKMGGLLRQFIGASRTDIGGIPTLVVMVHDD
jgi:hypothetical protein